MYTGLTLARPRGGLDDHYGSRLAVTVTQLLKDYFTHTENHESQVRRIITA